MSEAQHDLPVLPHTYLDVSRTDDGHYSVQFIKHAAPPRKSRAVHARAVVDQAIHAGYVPVRTDDEELRRACRDCQIGLV